MLLFPGAKSDPIYIHKKDEYKVKVNSKENGKSGASVSYEGILLAIQQHVDDSNFSYMPNFS